MKYRLEYSDILIGFIDQKDSDFLNMWGVLKRELPHESTDPKIVDLIKFIELSIRESDLVERESVEDVIKEFDELGIEFKPYLNFIDSDHWSLINNQGDIEKILAPSFKSDETIVWRWKL